MTRSAPDVVIVVGRKLLGRLSGNTELGYPIVRHRNVCLKENNRLLA